MTRFKRSWILFVRSLSVIQQNKTLLWFPLVSGAFTCLIVLFFVLPLAFWDTGHSFTESAHWRSLAEHFMVMGEQNDPTGLTLLGLACGAVVYLTSIILATFFNVAFYNEILHALNDNPVSISRGLRVALSKLKAILMWSMLTGIVGITIKALEEKLGFVGRWIMKLIGIAWSVAAVFAIPVIIREDKSVNPLGFLKRSAIMLKQTWGESLIGFLGIRFGTVVCLLGSLALFAMPLGIGLALRNVWLVIAAIALEFLCLVVITYLVNVASQVYRCALFIYASEGVVPGPYDQDMMDLAWKVRT